MTRLTLPCFPLRGRKNSHNAASLPNPIRPVTFERLSPRLVLTGVTELVGPEPATSETTDESSSLDSAVVLSTETSSTRTDTGEVQLDNDGVLHVHAISSEANIVVNQYINYALQEVVEIEQAGHWTAFAVQEVTQIQIHPASVNQPVEISNGVTVPVHVNDPALLEDPQLVDAALDEGTGPWEIADPVAESTTWFSGPVESGPEGEPSGIGDPISEPGQDPALQPPKIFNFVGEEENGYWLFSGQVTDDQSVEGLTIEFGGLLEGQTAEVNSEGWFLITAYFGPDVQGVVSAMTADRDDLESNTVYSSVNF